MDELVRSRTCSSDSKSHLSRESNFFARARCAKKKKTVGLLRVRAICTERFPLVIIRFPNFRNSPRRFF